jgi:hypothetical protein
MAIVASFGSRGLLRAIPFSPDERERLRLSARRQEADSPAGWPVPPTARERYGWRISQARAAGVSAALAWLMFCGLYRLLRSESNTSIVSFCYWLAVGFIVGRCWLYIWGYAPPMSLLGRIVTGRLVIPRYDVVLLAPLCAIAAGVLIPAALSAIGSPPAVTYSLACGTSIWLCLALPPTRESWVYTGAHRVCFRILASKEESSTTKRRRQSFRLSN